MKKVLFLLVLILAAGCNSKVCPAYTDSTNKMQSTIFHSGSSRADGIHRVYRDSPQKRWCYFSFRKGFFIFDYIISNYSGKIIIGWLQPICTVKCCLYVDYKLLRSFRRILKKTPASEKQTNQILIENSNHGHGKISIFSYD
jgi:hypothetical protein